MINWYFSVDTLETNAMHAEPIAALDALKLASLALQSTHSPAMGFLPERRETTLIAPITRDPCENCGLVAWQTAPQEWGHFSVSCRRKAQECPEVPRENTAYLQVSGLALKAPRALRLGSDLFFRMVEK